jgi:site-specific DNA-methyltransferase (adenine-specific)
MELIMKSGKMALGKGFKSEFELAWTNTENKATMLHLTHDGNIQGFNGGSVNYNYKSIHPTQKPVSLYKWLLDKYAKPNDKILDTHLGSMSIAIACHDYGFELVGCELDKEYYDKGIERVKNHVAQQKLF